MIIKNTNIKLQDKKMKLEIKIIVRTHRVSSRTKFKSLNAFKEQRN